jgi:tetratricopeptide (TPR) repeat protein
MRDERRGISDERSGENITPHSRSHAPRGSALFGRFASAGTRFDAAGSISLILRLSSLVLFLALLLTASAASAAGPEPPPSIPGPLVLDDAPQPLPPGQARTEADRDRVEAVALFAVGRACQQRQKYRDALRSYQRALRCDPQSATIVRAIIPVAIFLGRESEAARYALKLIDLDGIDPSLLANLAISLTKEHDWTGAAALYEKTIAAHANAKPAAVDVALWLELGRTYYMAEKYPQAAESFARVVAALDHPEQFAGGEPLAKALFDNPDVAYQLMGECFLSADRPKDAQAVFEKIKDAGSAKAVRQFNLARVYLKAGKPAEALAAIEACFAGHIADAGMDPYETLADVLAKLNKKNELIARLEKLRAAEPGNVPLGYFLATQYRAAGKPEMAEPLFIELLKSKPTMTGYRELADLYRKAKRPDALLGVLGEMIDKIGIAETLATAVEGIGHDAVLSRAAVETARAKLKADPAKCGYGFLAAAALVALDAKQYDAANELFNLALAAKPKQAGEMVHVWGLSLMQGERPAEAAKVFQRAIDEKIFPSGNAVFYYYLAAALSMAEKPDDALAAARKAADLKRGSARYRGRPAWVLYMAKRYDEALKAYRKLIVDFDVDHSSEESREAMREARLTLSNICVAQKDLPNAEEYLEQVLDEFPDDDGALNDLGYLWADENKNLGRAERMIRQAVAAEPDNAAYRDSLGWLLFRQGKFAPAVVELEKAAGGKKPDGTVLDHLGDACHKAGQHQKAIAAWRKAVEVLRKEKETDKAEIVEKKINAK